MGSQRSGEICYNFTFTKNLLVVLHVWSHRSVGTGAIWVHLIGNYLGFYVKQIHQSGGAWVSDNILLFMNVTIKASFSKEQLIKLPGAGVRG